MKDALKAQKLIAAAWTSISTTSSISWLVARLNCLAILGADIGELIPLTKRSFHDQTVSEANVC